MGKYGRNDYNITILQDTTKTELFHEYKGNHQVADWRFRPDTDGLTARSRTPLRFPAEHRRDSGSCFDTKLCKQSILTL